MQNEPDDDAMANRPLVNESDSVNIQQTTVIEGGPSGGLFLQDESSEDEVDAALTQAMLQSDSQSRAHEQSVPISGHHLNEDEEDDEDEEEEEKDNDDDDDVTMTDDEDDPVVQTIPIYAAKRLAEVLYLFQYPIRPANIPYEGAHCPTEARIKPKIGQVQMDVPIPDMQHYDENRATTWTDKPLRTQTLGGTISSGRNYLIGVMVGDELHVTPLAGVAQVRPVFKYIDDNDRDERARKKSEAATGTSRPAKALQMSAKSSDAVPDLSTTALIRAAEEENWQKLTWRDRLHEESETIGTHMLSRRTDVWCTPITDKETYLDMLSTSGKAKDSVPATAKKESK